MGEAHGVVKSMSARDNLRRGDGKVVDKVFGLKGHDEIEGNVKKALGYGQ